MSVVKNKIGWMAAVVLAVVCGVRADYVILSNDRQIDGTDLRRKLDGSVVILIPNAGKQEFAKGAYKVAVADMPAEFATAVQAYQAKQYQAAIDTLEKIAGDKSGLEVDKKCRFLASRCFIQLGKAADAVSQFDLLAKPNLYGPTVFKDPSVAVEYANALLAAKQNDKLGSVLDDIIKDGPRPAAAKAQTIRGQMRESQGQLDAAVIDYMRTVVFYEKDGAEAVPEALYRAARVLDMKKDPRAKKLYKQLADEYKDSPFAANAAGHT